MHTYPVVCIHMFRYTQLFLDIHISFWFVVWNIFYFSIYWEQSSDLTFIFFRGVGQPPTSFIQTSRSFRMYPTPGSNRSNWAWTADFSYELAEGSRFYSIQQFSASASGLLYMNAYVLTCGHFIFLISLYIIIML